MGKSIEQRSSTVSLVVALCLWCAISILPVQGFSSSSSHRLFGTSTTTTTRSSVFRSRPSCIHIISPSRHHRPLFAVEEEDDEQEGEAEEEETAATEANAEGDDGDDESPDEAAQEDTEMKALREEIDTLERELRKQKSVLQGLKDKAAIYSEKGYARKVAQMENLRRSSQSAQSSNEGTAVAMVLQKFVPILEDLQAKKEAYGDIEFGNQYTALNLLTSFSDLGVTMFDAGSPGDPVVAMRVATTVEEYNDTIQKGGIISTVKPGLELDGNVIRLAEAVVSLGKVGEQEVATASEEAASEEAASSGEE